MAFADLFRPKWKHGDWRVRLAAVKELADQGLLVEMAKKDREWKVRLAAVHGLTDQAALADVARTDKDKDVRLGAVEKLTDQAALIHAAKSDSDAQVRRAAVGKIADQALLAEIAKNDRGGKVRLAAVQGLTDQAALADVAENASDSDMRRAAVEKLTDQTALTHAAKSDSDAQVRRAAAGKVADQALLADLAKNASHSDVRRAAVEKVSDQALLAEVAKNDSFSGVREAAVGKITDQALLIEVGPWAYAGNTALVTDPLLLARIARGAGAYEVRIAAVGMLTDQAVLAQCATSDNYAEVRKAAVGNLTDQALVAQIAKNDGSASVRLAAAEKLTDQAVLAHCATSDNDAEVRRAAAANLTDQALLTQIAKDDSSASVRLAAAEKLTDQAPAQAVYADIARNDSSVDVRRRAAAKLTDQPLAQAVYGEIAKNDSTANRVPTKTRDSYGSSGGVEMFRNYEALCICGAQLAFDQYMTKLVCPKCRRTIALRYVGHRDPRRAMVENAAWEFINRILSSSYSPSVPRFLQKKNIGEFMRFASEVYSNHLSPKAKTLHANKQVYFTCFPFSSSNKPLRLGPCDLTTERGFAAHLLSCRLIEFGDWRFSPEQGSSDCPCVFEVVVNGSHRYYILHFRTWLSPERKGGRIPIWFLPGAARMHLEFLLTVELGEADAGGITWQLVDGRLVPFRSPSYFKDSPQQLTGLVRMNDEKLAKIRAELGSDVAEKLVPLMKAKEKFEGGLHARHDHLIQEMELFLELKDLGLSDYYDRLSHILRLEPYRSHCFVATACMGGENHTYVVTLRRFRDEILPRSPTGRWLVDFYARVGPYGAKLIAGSAVLRRLVTSFLIRPTACFCARWLSRRERPGGGRLTE